MNLFMFPFAHGVYDDAELTHDEFEVKTNDVQVSLSIILQQRILNFFRRKNRQIEGRSAMPHYSKSQSFVQKFNFDKTPTFSRVFHPNFF